MKRITKLFVGLLTVATLLLPSLSANAAVHEFQMGANDPTEVIASVDSGTKIVTLRMGYVYTPAETEGETVEELPNPGYMSDGRKTELLDYMTKNRLTGYKLIIEEGVKGIGSGAFSNCTSFTSIINNSTVLDYIGADAFSGNTNLTKVDLGDASITTLEPNLFNGAKSLTSVEIPDSVNTISVGAFTGTGLTEIRGGANVVNVSEGSITGGKNINLVTQSEAIRNYDWVASGYEQVTLDGTTKLFTVTFNTNVTATVKTQLVQQGKTVSEPTVVDTSSTFVGWFTDAELTQPFSFTTPIDKNLTLYAKWNPKTVVISYEANNGGIVLTQNVEFGGKTTKPTEPVLGEKVFVGWFKDAKLTQAVNFDTDTYTKDTTLYGKWKDPNYYTVSFDVGNAESIDEQKIREGGLVIEPTEPKVDDYTFEGWYTTSTYETKWDFSSDVVENDITLYSKWKNNFVTVKFDSRGGSLVAPITVERGKAASQPAVPTKDNSEFLGWFKDEAGTELYSFDAKVQEDVTLYAKWNQTAFTVKFESNGGSAVEAVVTNPDTLIARPSDPVKDGYVVVGWYSSSDFKTVWDFNANTVKGDMTLYAKWEPGVPPGVQNTGSAVPQTGDTTSALSAIVSLAITAGLTIAGKKKFF